MARRRQITRAPRWLSTDLRDGNQALIEPMDAGAQAALVRPAGRDGLQGNRGRLPAASQTDFDFVRKLIEERPHP